MFIYKEIARDSSHINTANKPTLNPISLDFTTCSVVNNGLQNTCEWTYMVIYVQPKCSYPNDRSACGIISRCRGNVTNIIPKGDLSFCQSTYSLSDSYVTCKQLMGLLILDKQYLFMFTVQTLMYV